MNDIRARFEEIWPVPAGVYWHDKHGCYLPMEDQWDYCDVLVNEWNDRLDTFTRCQETTAIYFGLIEELVDELEKAQDWIVNDTQSATVSILLTVAKKITEQKK